MGYEFFQQPSVDLLAEDFHLLRFGRGRLRADGGENERQQNETFQTYFVMHASPSGFECFVISYRRECTTARRYVKRRAGTIEDRGSKIEDRRSKTAMDEVIRSSILDPRSSILDP